MRTNPDSLRFTLYHCTMTPAGLGWTRTEPVIQRYDVRVTGTRSGSYTWRADLVEFSPDLPTLTRRETIEMRRLGTEAIQEATDRHLIRLLQANFTSDLLLGYP